MMEVSWQSPGKVPEHCRLLEEVAKVCGFIRHVSNCGLSLSSPPWPWTEPALTFKYLISLSSIASPPLHLALGTDLDLVSRTSCYLDRRIKCQLVFFEPRGPVLMVLR